MQSLSLKLDAVHALPTLLPLLPQVSWEAGLPSSLSASCSEMVLSLRRLPADLLPGFFLLGLPSCGLGTLPEERPVFFSFVLFLFCCFVFLDAQMPPAQLRPQKTLRLSIRQVLNIHRTVNKRRVWEVRLAKWRKVCSEKKEDKQWREGRLLIVELLFWL